MKKVADLLELNYYELLKYFKNKYGKANGSYYLNENYNSINNKIKRTSEGLQIHHDKEDSFFSLSKIHEIKNKEAKQKVIKIIKFKWQEPENLTYCDLLEHFLIHIKLFELRIEKYHENMFPPVGELHFIPLINHILYSTNLKGSYHNNLKNKINNKKKDFYKILFYRNNVLINYYQKQIKKFENQNSEVLRQIPEELIQDLKFENQRLEETINES